MLDAAVADKRINAKEKDIPEKLDIADVKAFLTDRKASQHPAAFIGSPSVKEGHENRTFADRKKQDPAGLAKMKTNDPEAYKALYKAEYGKKPKIN